MGLSQATGMPRNVFIGRAGAGLQKEGEREGIQLGLN